MARRNKDTDYLAISAEIRSLETRLLDREKREQLLAAPTAADAARLLRDWGYEALDPARIDTPDDAIAADRQALWAALEADLPDGRYPDVFRIPYDYHNLKVILKADAMGVNADGLLSDAGRVKADILTECVRNGDTEGLPQHLAEALTEGKTILREARDPQRSDIAIDRRCYQTVREAAEATGSAFLSRYVRTQTDAVNLRTLVRALRTHQTALLGEALMEGGEVDTESLRKIAEEGGAGLAKRYADTQLSAAAELGEAALAGGSLTAFEKACDDAAASAADARFVPFGDAVVPAYLAAKEREWADLRIILMGKQAGVDAEEIRARLRADGR